jgi:hypothetical protein
MGLRTDSMGLIAVVLGGLSTAGTLRVQAIEPNQNPQGGQVTGVSHQSDRRSAEAAPSDSEAAYDDWYDRSDYESWSPGQAVYPRHLEADAQAVRESSTEAAYESAVDLGGCADEGCAGCGSTAGRGKCGADGKKVCPRCGKPLPGGKAGGAAGPPKPYKGVFYENDFTYLELEDPTGPQLGDSFKQIHVGDFMTMDAGGEYRLRHRVDNNGGNLRLDGLDNDLLLQRTRLFANFRFGENFRIATEAIDATSAYEELTPLVINENRFDALNLFGDLKLWDGGDSAIWSSVGRRELLYGAQRLVSPLDWGNTRRTFDGAMMNYSGSNWNASGFWTRPVPVSQHVMNDHNFDNPDQSQEFAGLYTTYKGFENQTLDFYYLRYAEYDAPGTGPDFDYNTFGARWLGTAGDWLVDFEGGYQFGEVGAKNQSAGFFTTGLGYAFENMPWTPTVWGFFDWASGDRNPNDDTNGTFNQLFPLGHYYLGFLDLIARQNIQSPNLQLTLQPHKRVTFLAWWYIFHLQEARDSLYNAGGAPIRTDPTGAAGRYVGQELDFLLNFTLTPRAGLSVGYSHFFAGEFIEETGVQSDADLVYTQLVLQF